MTPWSPDLDLTSFYKRAAAKGYENNATQHMLVNCFSRERHSQTWIMYYNDQAVGSVASHSIDLPELGPDAYRICARTCVLTDMLPQQSLRTIKGITTHQNYTAQYFMPTCIEWTPQQSNRYITSTDQAVGSQRLVNKIFCPALEAVGVLEFAGTYLYRSTKQNFWRVNVKKFYEELNTYRRWD